MPYNPRVRHLYGQYAAQGYEQAGDYMARGTLGAAEATASGIRQSGQGIASGIESAGSSIASGIKMAGSVWAENKAMLGQAHGKIDAWQQAGLITPEETDAFAKIRDPYKLSGAVAVQQDIIQSRMMEQRQQQSQMRATALDLLKQEEDARGSRVGTAFKMNDPITGEPRSFYWQSDASVAPFQSPSAKDDKAVTGVTREDIGNGQFIYKDQQGRVISPSMVTKPETDMSIDPSTTSRINKLTREKAGLQGKIAEGDVLPGPDWLPENLPFRSPSHEKQLKGVEAELQGLQTTPGPSGKAAVSGTGQIQTGGGGAYKTPEEVKAALQAGTLSREEAIKILKEQFGM